MALLLLEPFGGLAGDMLLAGLLDLGDERFALDHLRTLADALVPGESLLATEEVRRGSFRALRLEVRTPESADPPHRHLADLLALLERAPLGARARARAAAALRRLAEAEARVHGAGVDEVHFHEVGAVDTLVDVAGAMHALDLLGVERVHATPPLAGSGTVEIAHGTLPVPAPGTAELLRGIPWTPGGPGEVGERCTPTGAAVLAALEPSFEPAPPVVVRAIGYGAGARDPQEGPPNALRVQLAEPVSSGGRAEAWLAETNLDDATGEEVGFLVSELRRAGALDAWSAAVQMKKERPGVVVSALCRAGDRERLERALLDHSTTLGVRWSRVERTECARETVEVELSGRRVRVKIRRRPWAERPLPSDLSPEHDDLAALARETGLPLRELERRAVEAALRADGGHAPTS